MTTFSAWFTHRGVYALPDGTRVIALWIELGDYPRWWFVAEQGDRPDRWGQLVAVIYPNRCVCNYDIEMDGGYPSLAIPYPSDLCVDDFRAVDDKLISTTL